MFDDDRSQPQSLSGSAKNLRQLAVKLSAPDEMCTYSSPTLSGTSGLVRQGYFRLRLEVGSPPLGVTLRLDRTTPFLVARHRPDASSEPEPQEVVGWVSS